MGKFNGNIFVNTYMSASGDLLAYFLAGFVLYKYLKFLPAMLLCFSLAIIGSVMIVIFSDSSVFPLFVLVAKFGIAGAFNIVYVANADLFPTLFTVTSFGICNFVSRFATIFAPNLAEVEGDTPMIICTCLCIMATMASLLVTTGPKARLEQEKIEK